MGCSARGLGLCQTPALIVCRLCCAVSPALCFPTVRQRVQCCPGQVVNACTGRPSLPVLSPPSASQTEYIPLHVSGKSLTVTEERETIQQSLNRYQGHPLPHPCPGASGMGLSWVSFLSPAAPSVSQESTSPCDAQVRSWLGHSPGWAFFWGLGVPFPLLSTGLGKWDLFQQVIENCQHCIPCNKCGTCGW